MTETPFICVVCNEHEVTTGVVCERCEHSASLRRRRAVEMTCDECGVTSEVYRFRAKTWVCDCQRKPAVITDRRRAQQFNSRVKRDHPSKWTEQTATPSEQRQVNKFLAQNPALMRQLMEDSSRLRARCSNYGATVAWWLIAVARQGGTCGVCGDRPDSVITLNIDHDHETGEARGLLCQGCNVGLGHLGIDGQIALDRARAVVRYVEVYHASKRQSRTNVAGS